MTALQHPPVDQQHHAGVGDVAAFPLLAALTGRRARRFSKGATIPDGPLAYSSKHPPQPLSDLERLMVLSAAGGATGWHYAITRNATYAPHLSNYSGSATGRTFPSAAGFHTSELFFTDDSGVYVFKTRDAGGDLVDGIDPATEPEAWVEAHRPRIQKLQDGRIDLPSAEPHIEGHNTWCVNVPGSLLVIPVADLAQHMIAGLCYFAQNGAAIYDDVHGSRIPGVERFGGLVDVDEPFPLTYVEQYMLAEVTAELSTSCYAGALMLQAMGLGGWMFDGIDRHSILGAGGDGVRGLGFRYDTDDTWSIPNVTGLEGVFEGYTPPHHTDMRAAVDAFCERKFGPGGPFHPGTPGAWKESPRVRSAAQMHSEEFRELVALQAQYIFDRFGKFPGTIPSIFCLTYLQAHHLDLDFYDEHFSPGAYLPTHAAHSDRWH